jgi:tetratricopeptide (TPR) repeat protein
MKLFSAVWFIGALLLPLLSALYADEVYSKTEAANRLYKQGKFEEALKLYNDALLLSPADPKLKMNKGSALYRTGDLDGAESNYQSALSAKEKKERAIAHYNLGNILFRKGDALMQQGDTKAQEQYKSALEHYIQALDLQPSDFDAKWNLQLAHQRIKQMEQQKQDQNNPDEKRPEPSEYAKKIKAKADQLVAETAYKEALDLMTSLLKTDNTADSYRPYTKRLKDVVDSQ